MAQKKIADLTEVQSVDENLCYVPVDNGSATVKIKLKNLEESATESAAAYAQAAAASATSASGYADAAALSSASASTYATNASESAQDAALSAGSASDSADAAAVSASNAASSASNVAAIVTDVSQQAAVALASATEAKSFAVGGTDTRAGEDTDNAKWYSMQAGTSASNAATSAANAASSEANAAASESNAATSETNASSSETNAATSATNAASSETNAGASATAAALSEAAAALSRAAAATSSEDSEAWSVGTRNGVPVPSTDPAYHNNAKFWAEAAAGAAGGGVTSFNGRAGAVRSQEHDYSANQVDFNNDDNGFIATNTQAAIEEVADNLSDLDTSLASVATTGSYADLSNTPTLGTAAAKNSTNTISSGNTALIESGAVYSLKQTLTNQANDMNNVLGAKNLLPFPYSNTSKTEGGITWTVNSDGSVSASGTATADSYFGFAMNIDITIYNNTILSGCPTGGEMWSKWALYVTGQKDGQYINIKDIGSGVLVKDIPVGYKGGVYAKVVNGQTVNFTFYPMIRPASITDDTYVPYSMTNQELTAEKADKSNLASISITGSTNNTGSTITKGTYFYKAGVLVKAKLDIANGATLTQNTNYEIVTAGGLNDSKIRIGEGTLPSVKETWDVVFTLPTGYTKDNTYLFLCNIYFTSAAAWYGRSDVYIRINASNQVEASSPNPNFQSVPCRIGFAHIV